MIKLKNLLLVLTLIIMTACSDNNMHEELIINEGLDQLTIAILPSLDSLPIIIADQKGFFEEEGLIVNIEQFTSARDRDVAFQVSPHIDGLVFDLVAATIYYEGGTHMVATSATTGLASILGNEDILTLEQLEGSSVLISRNTSMEFILHTALESVGLTPNDVLVDEVPALPTRLEMILHNQAGAATLPEPFATMGLEQELNLLTTTRDLNINPFIFAFRYEVIEDKIEEIDAFYRALNKAVDYLNTADREEFIDILINEVGYPQHVRETLVLPEFYPFNAPSIEDAEKVIAWSTQMGLLTKDLNPSNIVTDIFGD